MGPFPPIFYTDQAFRLEGQQLRPFFGIHHQALSIAYQLTKDEKLCGSRSR